MKRKNFFTGSVFEFYVPEIRKYAFCKYFDFTHLSSFHGLLAQVFNFFSDTEGNSVDHLKKSDWLFGPRSMHKWPNLRSDTGWKSIGVLNGPHDDQVPDFKSAQTVATMVEDESQIGPWYAIHMLTQRGPNCAYEQVRHLEQIKLTTAKLGLIWRTGMEFCRINGLAVEDYYDLEEEGRRNMYNQMINTPMYKNIPMHIRGKALRDA
jgi:hypothetical protein